MSKIFISKAQQYASCHTKKVTKITHFIGVPIIIFSLMIFFGFIKIVVPNIFTIKLSSIVIIILLAYYFKLQWQLTLTVAPLFFLLNYLASMISSNGPTTGNFEIFFLLFVFGWIIQIVGHFYEKKRPAFIDNLSQVFIAPLFLIAEAYFHFGMMHELYLKIYDIDQETIDKNNKERFEQNNEESFNPKSDKNI
jgi:uncharacterized membrane protein YGL010W